MLTNAQIDKKELRYRTIIEKSWGILQPDGGYISRHGGDHIWDADTWRKIITLRIGLHDYINGIAVGDQVTLARYSKPTTGEVTKINYKRGTDKQKISSFGVRVLGHYSDDCSDESCAGKPYYSDDIVKPWEIDGGNAIQYLGVSTHDLSFKLGLCMSGWDRERSKYDQDIWDLVDNTKIRGVK